MTRHLVTTALAAFALLGTALAARAQQEAERVVYYDRALKKDATITSQVTKITIAEETPTKLTFKQGAKTIEVPLADLRELEYGVGAGLKPTYHRAMNQETEMLKPDARDAKKSFEESLAAYREVQTGLKDKGLTFAARHLQFSVGRLLARRAEADPSQVDQAVKELSKFIEENPNAWQLTEAARLLGQQYEAAGKKAEAAKVYEDLVARNDLPKEARQEFDFLLARALIQGGKHAQAQARLEKMAKELPAADPNSGRVQVYLAECQAAAGKYPDAEKGLRAVLDGQADYAVKGMAANTLADCYRLSGKPEEAMWEYLWVDQVYNQDKGEHARALYHLSKLFDSVKHDAARAQACRDRLLKEKDFIGQEFQKRAAREDAGMK